MEPGFAAVESQYNNSQLCTAVPGVVTIVAWLGLMNAVRDNWDAFMSIVVGRSPESNLSLSTFLLAATVGALSTVVSVAVVYRRCFGFNYCDDRISFAMVGGFDIARWVPMAAFISVFGGYFLLHSFWPPNCFHYIRGLGAFLGFSFFVSHSLAIYLSYQFFREPRFGLTDSSPTT